MEEKVKRFEKEDEREKESDQGFQYKLEKVWKKKIKRVEKEGERRKLGECVYQQKKRQGHRT